jgi:arylsulfatase A-like enzyme
MKNLLCYFLLFLPVIHAASAQSRPNIIFMITDDQGYGDISAHGNPVLKTPHLDRLREQSVRFTNFQVSPTCAPTRSALLTGRHEFRNGVTHTILERERLTLDAVTLPQILKPAGYTTGIFGKWHLGDEPAYRPDRRGFDEVFIHGAGGIGQTFPGSCGDAPGNTYFDPAILHNNTFEKTIGYCTDVFFEAAQKWIGAQKDRAPFFCWIATNAPHSPYNARPEDRALYAGRGLGEETENFFGMIHNIDENIGRLLAKLDEWKIAENTLVVVMNDNGGTAGVKIFNAGMRGAKGTPWIGGTRAFSFWRWPGRFHPGDCSALTAHVDFFKTITTLAGAPLTPQAEKQIEGRDLGPLLADPAAAWPDRTLVTHVGRWPKGDHPATGKYRNCSIRDSRFTLVSIKGTAEPAWELYDISTDPAQAHNIAQTQPAELQRLASAYETWWTSVQPQLVNETAIGPAVNPFKELYWKQFGGGPEGVAPK